MIVEALWNGEVIAASRDTVVVEGNHYFSPKDVKRGNLVHSDTTTVCSWKGPVSYFSINAGGAMNSDAAWTYHDPKPFAVHIKDHIAFAPGIDIVER